MEISQKPKLWVFWFCDLGVSFILRPFTLKMRIFDGGGHLRRTRSGSENLGMGSPQTRD